jgi:hypothetical protein
VTSPENFHYDRTLTPTRLPRSASVQPCAAAPNGGIALLFQSPRLVAAVAELGSLAASRHRMRKSTPIVVAAVLLTIFAFLILLRRSSPISVTVGFVSLTNDALGHGWATFGVTNSSTFTVRRWGCYSPEERARPGLFVTHTFGPNAMLKPGQSEVVAIPVISTASVWRAVFSLSREGPRSRFYDYSNRWPKFHAKLPGVPTDLVPTEWITQ